MAIVLFEVKNSKNLSEQEIKDKLVLKMCNDMDLWIKGEGTMKIEFIKDKKDVKFTEILPN